ncbi:MAG: hypothetical protein ACE37H_08035 [Phycisphaeraceae bacterium]
MTPAVLNTAGFRFEPGEHIGDRFVVAAWDESDPVWPVRAVDALDSDRAVQLAVRALGPWSSIRDAPSSACESVWADTTPEQLPMVTCPRLRHGGGVLELVVTPDLPPALSPLPASSPEFRSVDLLGVDFDGDTLTTAPATVLRTLASLDRLHHAAQTVEVLHASRLAHGALDATSFRRGPKGQTCLRPVPGWHQDAARKDPADEQDRDLLSLQHLVREVMSSDVGVQGVEQVLEAVSPGDPHFRGRFLLLIRGVIGQRENGAADNCGVGSWRNALNRVIGEIEAAWLTEAARGHRRQLISSLFVGDHDTVLANAQSSPDPWCIELARLLRQRQSLAANGYHQWRANARDLPLGTCAQQMIELVGRGYDLPESPPIDVLCRRLIGSTHQLREAAAGVRGRDWAHAHSALSAASSLDPVNTALVGLTTLTAHLYTQTKD